MRQDGFTLVEMLMVIGIIVVIVSLTLVNLGQPQTGSRLGTTADTLLADLKSQQLLAMTGGVGSTTLQQPHGILVQANQYILFAGASYNAGDSNNFTITAPQNTTFGTTLPSSTVLFTKGTGAITGYTAGSNTITITTNSAARTITLTRFGATAVN